MHSDTDTAVAVSLQTDLHDMRTCVGCAGTLVQPTLWRPTITPGVWFIALRCPDCGERRHGFADEAEFDRLDEAVNAGFIELQRALADIATERMAHDCERLIGAINAGAILPEDFGPLVR